MVDDRTKAKDDHIPMDDRRRTDDPSRKWMVDRMKRVVDRKWVDQFHKMADANGAMKMDDICRRPVQDDRMAVALRGHTVVVRVVDRSADDKWSDGNCPVQWRPDRKVFLHSLCTATDDMCFDRVRSSRSRDDREDFRLDRACWSTNPFRTMERRLVRRHLDPDRLGRVCKIVLMLNCIKDLFLSNIYL